MRALVLAVAVLASVPWQGVAYTDHTVTRVVPLGNTGAHGAPAAVRADLHASGLEAAPVGAAGAGGAGGLMGIGDWFAVVVLGLFALGVLAVVALLVVGWLIEKSGGWH